MAKISQNLKKKIEKTQFQIAGYSEEV